MPDDRREGTRRGLHAVAELVLAGPQYRTSGTIRLRVDADGIGTVAAPDLRLDATHLVREADRIPISGTTPRALAEAIGVDPGAPAGLYEDGSGVSLDDRLVVDPDAAAEILSAYLLGAAAFGSFAPDVHPVLWPEHFDLGIRVDDLNYGISAGDAFLPVPYAYVGADPVPADDFWNAPFGAARPATDFENPDQLRGFLEQATRRWQAR